MNVKSAQIDSHIVPAEIRGWNWGAFWLCWIWGVGHKTYIALLGLLPGVNVVISFVLGAMGNRWAWQNRAWESVEQFREVQKAWSVFGWGMAAGFLSGVLTLASLVGLLIIPVFF